MNLPFVKYQALGNDYLVVDPAVLQEPLTIQQIRCICDRHYGPGSDGILVGPLPTAGAAFGLRIFNPDGSEAEKSGNGLRIFARYLWDTTRLTPTPDGTGSLPFRIDTAGGTVQAEILEHGRTVRVEMGKAVFDSRLIPVAGPPRQVIDEELIVDGEKLRCCAVTLGNPHCVILNVEATETAARRLGPLIERDPRFPNRTNVQFLRVNNRREISIHIWERGAGYTLASGSSSCAAAAAAHRLDRVDDEVIVHNPGGEIRVEIRPDQQIRMTGPVAKVYDGRMEMPGC